MLCKDIEIWKDIEGYEGLYQVSNTGKVRSLNYNRTGRVQELRLVRDKDGYFMVHLCKNGEGKHHLVHRLVAQAFIPNPDNLPVINHKDEVKTNNRVENLEWCTIKYNNEYSGVYWSRRPVFQYTKEGVFVAEYESSNEASRQTGVNQGNISNCCFGIRKSAGGFIWRFKED